MALKAMVVHCLKNNGRKAKNGLKEFGLEGQVEIELIDYRDVAASGRTFDRIVSVGMWNM